MLSYVRTAEQQNKNFLLRLTNLIKKHNIVIHCTWKIFEKIKTDNLIIQIIREILQSHIKITLMKNFTF